MDIVASALLSVLSGVVASLITFFVQRSFRKKDLEALEKLKSSLRTDQEKLLIKTRIMSGSQMAEYQKLWDSLVSLEDLMDNLWENDLSEETLREFVEVVTKADKRLRLAELIIDTESFKSLMDIMRTIKGYQVGKQTLLELRDFDEYTSKLIQEQIERNFDMLSEYKKLKNEVLLDLKGKLEIG